MIGTVQLQNLKGRAHEQGFNLAIDHQRFTVLLRHTSKALYLLSELRFREKVYNKRGIRLQNQKQNTDMFKYLVAYNCHMLMISIIWKRNNSQWLIVLKKEGSFPEMTKIMCT